MRTEMVFVPVSVHRSIVVVVCLRHCRLLGSVQGAAESEVAEQSLLLPPVLCLFIILHPGSPLSSLLHAELPYLTYLTPFTYGITASGALLPLEDDVLITLDRLWEQMVEKERCEALAQALAALPEEDREIFYRFYDLSQTTAQIADELHMNASTVRSRLLRGREALRKTLTKGGLFCEDDVG